MRFFYALSLFIVMTSLVLWASSPMKAFWGDRHNGQKLVKGSDFVAHIDSAWLNSIPPLKAVGNMAKGTNGFPHITSTNPLDRYDALAYLQSIHTSLLDLAAGGNTALVFASTLDEYAQGRLREKAKFSDALLKIESTVFGIYKMGDDAAGNQGMILVTPQDTTKRDALKKKFKIGHIVFIPTANGGEIGFFISPEIKILHAIARNQDGSLDIGKNNALKKMIGKGQRGQYSAVGGDKTLSNAFLLAAEHVYMFEVNEKDYFQFGE